MTGIVGEHGGRGGRVEGTMMEEPERGLPENRKWTQIKSREQTVRAASDCFGWESRTKQQRPSIFVAGSRSKIGGQKCIITPTYRLVYSDLTP